MNRRRLRTFTLWTGTLLCVLIVAAFVVSAWWQVVIQVEGGYVCVTGGKLVVGYTETRTFRLVLKHTIRLSQWNVRGFVKRSVHVPLYAVFVIVAIPTLVVWRLWPKPVKPGHCRCGYDLRGNTSGVCPECGVEVQA